MTKRDAIVVFLDEYLKIREVQDDSWNGLQFEGSDTVKKIVTAVDAAEETFERAVKAGADMVIVHHGHFWEKADPSLKGAARKRFELLFKHNISLYASHLPLDRHPVIGNNAQLLKIVGAKRQREAFMYHGMSIGYVGEFSKPVSVSNIAQKLFASINAECTVLPFGKEKIRTVGVCSGGGGFPAFNDAVKEGVDLYITGETTEVYHLAKEAGIHVIFAGHHATETVGVKALGETLRKRFGIPAEFIDIPTGL